MSTQGTEDLQFWDNPNSPQYSLVQKHRLRKSLLDRAMPILVVILTILVAILLPLAITNHAKINETKGMKILKWQSKSILKHSDAYLYIISITVVYKYEVFGYFDQLFYMDTSII